MCDFAHVLDIIKHCIFVLYNYMCVTIETFICKGVKNIVGVINDRWHLPATWREHVMENIGESMDLHLAQMVSKNAIIIANYMNQMFSCVTSYLCLFVTM